MIRNLLCFAFRKLFTQFFMNVFQIMTFYCLFPAIRKKLLLLRNQKNGTDLGRGGEMLIKLIVSEGATVSPGRISLRCRVMTR